MGFNSVTITVAILGNYFGSCTTYYLGLKGRPVLEKYLSPFCEKLEKSEGLFKKYGIYTLFLTWVPAIEDTITIVTGPMELPF